MTVKTTHTPNSPASTGDHIDDREASPPPPDTGGTNVFDPAALEIANLTSTPSAENLFDPAFLTLTQDFEAESTVAKVWDVIKVEKPSSARAFRVNADPAYRVKTMLLVLKDDNETYLIHPQMRSNLASESLVAVYTVFACVSKQGTPFIWPIRMQDADGKWLLCFQTAFQIAERAMTRWARMEWSRDAGYYVAKYDMRPPEQQHTPVWPDLPFQKWLELAFRGHIIDTPDHPVLRRLRLED